MHLQPSLKHFQIVWKFPKMSTILSLYIKVINSKRYKGFLTCGTSFQKSFYTCTTDNFKNHFLKINSLSKHVISVLTFQKKKLLEWVVSETNFRSELGFWNNPFHKRKLPEQSISKVYFHQIIFKTFNKLSLSHTVDKAMEDGELQNSNQW